MAAASDRIDDKALLRSRLSRLEPAETQLLCRAVNEQIRTLATDSTVVELVCECAKPGCWEVLTVSPGDYEEVRRFPTRFITLPGHASIELERIVADNGGFLVVEKLGSGAHLAIRTDPRRHAEPLSS